MIAFAVGFAVGVVVTILGGIAWLVQEWWDSLPTVTPCR